MKKTIILFGSIVSLVVLSSCANVDQKADDTWVVKVNNEAITTSEVQTGLINLSSDLQQQIPKNKQTQYVVEQLVRNEIIYQEALKNSLEQNEDYQNFLDRLSNQFEYQKKQGLVDFFIREKIDSSIQITEQEVEATYEQNKATLFSEFEQRSISHIVVKTEGEASDIIKSLKRGANFGTLAKTKSIDVQTAQNGGKIPGFFRKEGLNKEFSESIFNLSKVGKYTNPVSSQAGFHIFKLDEIQVTPAKTFTQVKDFITNQLYLNKRNQEISDLLTNIKDQYEISQNEELTSKQNNKKEESETTKQSKSNG